MLEIFKCLASRKGVGERLKQYFCSVTFAINILMQSSRPAIRDLVLNICSFPISTAPIEEIRAQICKRLRSPGIDSKESIQAAYVAWRPGTSNRVLVPARQAGNRFLGSLKG